MATGVAHDRLRRHPLPERERPPAARPIVEDFADVFMTRNDDPLEVEIGIGAAVFARHLENTLATLEKMRVGCAQPAAVSAYQRLSLAGNGIGHLAHMYPIVQKIRCFHRESLMMGHSARHT